MNLAELQRKLLAAARTHPPGGEVPYAFEKRVMHRLRLRQPEDVLAWWGAAMWRGALSCVAVAVLLSALSLWPHQDEVSLGQLYEDTLYSAAEKLSDSW